MSVRSSLRKNIEDSKNEFLDGIYGGTVEEGNLTNQNETIKKKRNRKISFKIRKTPSTYRRNYQSASQKPKITSTTVAELTSKFNEIIEKNNAPKVEIKIRKFVARLNSLNSSTENKTMKNIIIESNEQNTKVLRKPSIKKKPVVHEMKKTHNIQLKSDISENLEMTKIEKKEEIDGQISENISRTSGFVRAAIKNFEEKKFQPISTKRSMTELHKIGPVLDTNRRNSCKPDILVPSSLKIYEYKKMDDFLNHSKSENKTASMEVEPKHSNYSGLNVIKSTIIHSDPPPLPSRLNKPKERMETGENNLDISSNCNLPTLVSNDEESKSSIKKEFEYPKNDTTDKSYLTLEFEKEESKQDFKPNNSFLWNRSPSKQYEDIEPSNQSLHSFSTSKETDFRTLPKNFKDCENKEDYEELDENDGYEPFDLPTEYEEVESKIETQEEDQYEFINNGTENIYETLPCTRQDEPLPKTPIPEEKKEEIASDCYESIYNNDSNSTLLNEENNYESIYFKGTSDRKDVLENDISGSIVSSEQKTNSLYGTSLRSWNDGTIYNSSATSDISFSDKSDWVDISENEYDGGSKIFM